MLLTDPAHGLPRTLELARALAEAFGQAFVLQLRDRHGAWSFVDKLTLGLEVQRLGAPVWVNRDVALADALGAQGVHASEHAPSFEVRSMPAHSSEEACAARHHGANALLVSPVFAVPGKGPPCGLELVRAVAAQSPGCQVWALGGIDASNARSCIEAGAVGVAMQRALYHAADPVGLVRGLW